ncbi:MAG TPA: histidine kinase [Arachidicoccus sp.]|nr:histidine kinase [Arachidicoccus sp.]
MTSRNHPWLFVMLFLFGAAVPFLAVAQSTYNAVKYNISDGLPSENVYDITEDSIGNLYLSTNRGILLYDGYRFVPLKGTRSATKNILYTHNYFYTFYPQYGIAGFKNVFDTLSIFRPNNFYDADPNNDQYYQLYLDSFNQIWCADINNIKYYATNHKDTGIFVIDSLSKSPLDNIAFCEPKHNQLWAITTGGIFIYDQISKQLSKTKNKKLSGHYLTGYYDKSNTLYLSTISGKILKYNLLTDSAIYLPGLENGLAVKYFSVLEYGSRSQLVLATDHKLFLYNEYAKSYDLIYDGGNAIIQNIHLNHPLHIIWLATTKGLIKVSRPSDYLETYPFPAKTLYNISVITKDASGAILAAQGNHIWKYKNGIWSRFTFERETVQCTDITFYKGQPLLSTNNGLYILKKNKIDKFLLKGLPSTLVIKFCYYDTHNRLWIIPLNEPIKVFNMDSKTELVDFLTNRDSIAKDNVLNAVTEDSNGKLWFAAWFPKSFGIAYYDEKKRQIKSLADDIKPAFHGRFMGDYFSGLSKTANGDLLFCGSGGWNLVSLKGEILKLFNTELYNVSSNMIANISADSSGNIWFSTDEGLNVYNPRLDKLMHFGQAEGLPTDDLMHGYYQTKNNRLLLGVDNAIVSVNQSKALQTNMTNKLELTTIRVNGQLLPNTTNNLTLNKDENEVEFNFSTYMYSDNQVIFRYRFQEDTGWTTLDFRPTLSLAKLPPGTYHIEIQAGDKLGNFQQKQLFINLKIPTPYYKTWWFTVVVFLLSALLIFLAVRYYFMQQKIKHSLKDRIKDARMQALRAQMKPHFIFNVLNSIESYIIENDSKTAAKLIQKFASLCRLILENSSQMIVNADREWEALNLYTEFECIRFPGRFRYSFNKEDGIKLSEILIPPMMVQPLIENAIHHGIRNSAQRNLTLKIEVFKSEDTIVFIINDNGIGLKRMQDDERNNSGLPVKQKSLGISMITERIDIINQSLGRKIASFTLTESKGYTVATLVLPIFEKKA